MSGSMPLHMTTLSCQVAFADLCGMVLSFNERGAER